MKLRSQLETAGIHEASYEASRILRDFVSSHLALHLPMESLLVLHDGRVAHSLDSYIPYVGACSATNHGYRLTFELSFRNAVRFDLEIPVPVSPEGTMSVPRIGADLSLTSLAFFLTSNNFDVGLDVAKLGKGFAVTRESVATCYLSDNIARFSDPAKPLAAIRSILKHYGAPNREIPNQLVTNPFLAELAECLNGSTYECHWNEGFISQFYADECDPPYESCMSGGDRDMFEMYDDLQRNGFLRLIHLRTKRGETKGRALCWEIDGVKHLDRIYCPYPNGVQSPIAIAAFKAFCKAEGITHNVSCKNPNELDLVTSRDLKISYHYFSPASYEKVPYVDSFRYCGYDSIATYQMCGCVGEFSNTDGDLDRDDYDDEEEEDEEDYFICRVTGDRIPVSEAILLDSCHYGSHSYAGPEHVVSCYDGRYCLTEDTVELPDGGDQIHKGEVTYVGDLGAYYLNSEVILIDGEPWPRGLTEYDEAGVAHRREEPTLTLEGALD